MRRYSGRRNEACGKPCLNQDYRDRDDNFRVWWSFDNWWVFRSCRDHDAIQIVLREVADWMASNIDSDLHWMRNSIAAHDCSEDRKVCRRCLNIALYDLSSLGTHGLDHFRKIWQTILDVFYCATLYAELQLILYRCQQKYGHDQGNEEFRRNLQRSFRHLGIISEAVSSDVGSRLGRSQLFEDKLLDFAKNVVMKLVRLSSNKLAADEIAASLDSKILEVRTFAIQVLGMLGSHAAPHIGSVITLLADTPEDENHVDFTRNVTVQALANLGHVVAPFQENITMHLNASRSEVREAALRVLGNLGPAAAPSVELVGRLLGDDHATVRKQAIAALTNIGDAASSYTGEVVRRVSDEDYWVSCEACGFLHAFPSHALPYLDILKDLLDSEDIAKRLRGLAACTSVGSVASPLAAVVARNLQLYLTSPIHASDDEIEACRRALEALGHMGERASDFVETMAACLSSDHYIVKHRSVESLVRLGEHAKLGLSKIVVLLSQINTVGNASHVIANLGEHTLEHAQEILDSIEELGWVGAEEEQI